MKQQTQESLILKKNKRLLRWRKKYIAVISLTFLTGCSNLTNPYQGPPKVDIPSVWNHQVGSSSKPSQSISTWWRSLNDPVLNKIITQAQQNNIDVKIAYSRVLEARAFHGITKASDLPVVQGSASVARQDIPLLGDEVNTTRSLLAQSVWEADLFGRIKNLKESSKATYHASVETQRDVQVLLTSEVVSNYALAKSMQQRIYYAKQNIQTQKESLKLAKARYDAQLVSELDVKQAEQNLANTESQIPLLRAQLNRALNRLSVLTGNLPGSLKKQIVSSRKTPTPSSRKVRFIPRDLVRQRPDIRRSERLLAAQTARVGIAEAELYPRLTLSGVFGFSANSGSLLQSTAKTWSFGPQLSWNIFSGGRIKNQIAVQKLRTNQARLDYENTVLKAFEEVENSLSDYGEQLNRTRHLEKSVEASKLMVDIVKTRYSSGLTEFQPLLDAERTLFLAEDRLAESKGLLLVHYSSIYRSLGGGWKNQLTKPSKK